MAFVINYLEILVAAIAAFVFGGLWYGPLFGKTWQKWMGITKKEMKSMKLSATKAMIMGFVVTLIAAFAASLFVNSLGIFNAAGAVQLAFWAWLAFAMPINIGAYLWENRPIKLIVLTSAHRLIELFIIIAILAYWH
jgi:hypothetical protein